MRVTPFIHVIGIFFQSIIPLMGINVSSEQQEYKSYE